MLEKQKKIKSVHNKFGIRKVDPKKLINYLGPFEIRNSKSEKLNNYLGPFEIRKVKFIRKRFVSVEQQGHSI